jgi:NADH-quinone oxidoreductase subunit L
MPEMSSYLVLIPLLPLAAFVLTALLGPRLLRQHSHWPCILGAVGACVLSLLVLFSLGEGQPKLVHDYYPWIQTGPAGQPGSVNIAFSLQADALTAIMLCAITFVGSLIAIYSAGYMHGDAGYPRYFAIFALFLFSMTGLVLADNFLVLYGFWEGVGLCSYLLIGFWFNKPSAAAAARKAFLVTRIGDVGFLIGILLIWVSFGYSLSYEAVFARAPGASTGLLTTICLLLFCGAVGKSAQFPLHVWLPDAMEGPTPVSALIHAATMVTAGVYLVARCTPLFVLTPDAQLTVACIGGGTAFLAAFFALTQNDLKRVLAYSTISQLGYMFLALGCATATPTSHTLVKAAVVAAIFHLFTHAFFKALLFLSAGSVMHAMGNVIDMRRFGGLRHVLKTTHWTFLCGAGALAGVPLLSGFWSKDEILSSAFAAGGADHPYRAIYFLLFCVGLITAGLTAFYTFRAYFGTFCGELRTPPEAGHHVHESPPVMAVPLMILAVCAVLVGYLNAEAFHLHWFSSFLERVHTGPEIAAPSAEAEGVNYLVMALSIIFAAGGIGVAWQMYLVKPGLAGLLAEKMQVVYQGSLNKLYIDELYHFFIVQSVGGIAYACRILDLRVVDGLVNFIGEIPRLIGMIFRPVQNGLTQFYGLAMALGLAVFLLRLVWLYAW